MFAQQQNTTTVPTTLQQFVEQVFTGEPKPPRSYTLTLDTEFTNTTDDLKTVFECLTTVFTLGMKHRYSDENGKVDLINITPVQFQYMKDYFKSFGFEVMYEAKQHEPMRTDMDNTDNLPSFDEDVFHDVPFSDERTANNLNDLPTAGDDKLDDYFLTLKTEHLIYRIWFSFLQ